MAPGELDHQIAECLQYVEGRDRRLMRGAWALGPREHRGPLKLGASEGQCLMASIKRPLMQEARVPKRNRVLL